MIELFQPVKSQYTVFFFHLHEVCRYANGTQIKHGNEARERNTIVFGKGLHELKANPTTRKVFKGIVIIGAFGIKNGHSGRHLFIGYMMVAYNEVDAQRLGVSYFVDSLYSAVKNDNQFYARMICVIYALAANTIAFFVAIGYIILDVRVELLKEFVHECH